MSEMRYFLKMLLCTVLDLYLDNCFDWDLIMHLLTFNKEIVLPLCVNNNKRCITFS